MTPEEERGVRVAAAVLDDPDGRARVYCAAMLALTFCATPEGFGRFRRWLGEQGGVIAPGPALRAQEWTPQGLSTAARVLAARTILDGQGDGDPS